jgi:hypothetical protein
MDSVKTIEGLQTEIPANMNPTARTIQILMALEKKGAVCFQADDGDVDYNTLKQLTEIAGNVGYDLLGYRTREAVKLNQEKDIPGSGCYILFFSDDIEID